MAVHAIRSGVPAAQRDHFVIVYQGEADLKRVTGFRDADDAYVLLLNQMGGISWTAHGSVSELFTELKKHISLVQHK